LWKRDPKFSLEKFKEQVDDAVIKTLLSIEQKELDQFVRKLPTSYAAFSFQSFDFFMDENYVQGVAE
jgi:hypothetical protein